MKKIVLAFVFGVFFSLLAYGQIQRDITISISGGITSDVVNAYAWAYNYQEQIGGSGEDSVPNPESKNAFALRLLAEETQNLVRSNYISYMRHLGSESAAAQANIDSTGITVQ